MNSNQLKALAGLLLIAFGLACCGASAHHITLTWDPPAKIPPKISVVGYNVYRSENGDSGFSKIATKVQSPYDDYRVMSGHTYYYAVTAVFSAPSESQFSEKVHATVP
jgi:fibronectin type 3 domain-containing protein